MKHPQLHFEIGLRKNVPGAYNSFALYAARTAAQAVQICRDENHIVTYPQDLFIVCPSSQTVNLVTEQKLGI